MSDLMNYLNNCKGLFFEIEKYPDESKKSYVITSSDSLEQTNAQKICNDLNKLLINMRDSQKKDICPMCKGDGAIYTKKHPLQCGKCLGTGQI